MTSKRRKDPERGQQERGSREEGERRREKGGVVRFQLLSGRTQMQVWGFWLGGNKIRLED